MGAFDPDWPTINLRDAIDKGLIHGPRLIVAAQGAFPCRCHLGLSKVADSPAKIRELVRTEHAFGGDWIKTMNTGGYMSFGDDPAKVTWFDDEMQCQAAWKFRRDVDEIERAQKRMVTSAARVAYGTDCGMFAMSGDPLADIAATQSVDFVMRAGRIYRHEAFDLFRA